MPVSREEEAYKVLQNKISKKSTKRKSRFIERIQLVKSCPNTK